MRHYLIIDEILPDDFLETYLYGHCPFCKASYEEQNKIYFDCVTRAYLTEDKILPAYFFYENDLGQKCRMCHSFITFAGTLQFQPRVDRFHKIDREIFSKIKIKFKFVPLRDKEWALDNGYDIPFSEIAKAHYELEFG